MRRDASQLVVLLVFSVFIDLQCVTTSAVAGAAGDQFDVGDVDIDSELLTDVGLHKKDKLQSSSAHDNNNVPVEKAIIIPRPSKALLVSTINNWIVIQNKVMHGATSFYKPWVDYRNAFGPLSLSDNFWIGLDHVHRLTSSIPQYRLRVEILRSSSPDWFFAEYESFSVSSEATGFRLRVSGYSGNAGDALTASTSVGNAHGLMFSTCDRDNDQWSGGNCAAEVTSRGGWWWNHCSWSNINMNSGGTWTVEGKGGDVTTTRMMIKLRQ